MTLYTQILKANSHAQKTKHQQQRQKEQALTQCQRIEASVMSVYCPHCGYKEKGWSKDPRGQHFECERCAKEYEIPEEVDIELT